MSKVVTWKVRAVINLGSGRGTESFPDTGNPKDTYNGLGIPQYFGVYEEYENGQQQCIADFYGDDAWLNAHHFRDNKIILNPEGMRQ